MKKMLRRLAVLCLAAAMTVSLMACSTKPESSGSDNTTQAGDSAQASKEAAKEKIKVTLCIGRKNDLSFQQSAYEGALRVQKELSDYYDVTIVEMGEDQAIWESSFYDAAESGADIIVGTGYQNKERFETIPQEYPDSKFILFDQEIDHTKGELSNVLTCLFDSNQSGFLSGVVASYYTVSENAANTDKTVGFVGGMDSVSINNFLVGYAEGAKYVDPTTKVLRAYVGDYLDTAKAKDITNAQISDGADIIFQVAGGAGNGTIEACAETDGVMAIGVDSDQFEALAGTNLQSSIITSSLKRLDNVLFKLLSDYLKDPNSVPFGNNEIYGMKDDAVGIVFNDNLTKSIGEQNVTKVQDILKKIQSGEIVVSRSSEMTSDEINAVVAK